MYTEPTWVSRISSASPTGETFDFHAADFDLKEYFKGTFGTYQTSETYRVVVEFSDVAAQLARKRHWHASQKLKDLHGGRLRLEVEVSHLDDIWPWINVLVRSDASSTEFFDRWTPRNSPMHARVFLRFRNRSMMVFMRT